MIEKLSVVVPCYNEDAVLGMFYEQLKGVLTGLPCGHEIIFVDDGSRDGTLSILKALASRDSSITYLSFSRNFGKESAMYAGLCNASGDAVVLMDADLQHDPGLIPEMLDGLLSGEWDCVAARRVTREGEPKIRSWFARRFYRIINKISDAKMMDGAQDFRIMSRQMTDAVIHMSETVRFSKGLFAWVGFRTKWIAYENRPRVAGMTKWSFWGLVRYAIDGIVNFSMAPLLLPVFLAGMSGGIAVIMLIAGLISAGVTGTAMSGWYIAICVMLFLTACLFGTLGLTGQYLARLFQEVKHRPHYIISETNRAGADRIR